MQHVNSQRGARPNSRNMHEYNKSLQKHSPMEMPAHKRSHCVTRRQIQGPTDYVQITVLELYNNISYLIKITK